MNLESRRVISHMSEQSTPQINFNDALNILSNASKEAFTTDVWIPSLKRHVKIEELSAKQQKGLLESAIDSTVAKSTFSKHFYEIVSSNCTESKEVIEQFTIADKFSIAFAMRAQISDNIEIVFQEEPKISSLIPLKDIIDKINTYEHPTQEVIKFSKNNIELETTIEMPLFFEEDKFDLYIYGKDKKENNVEEFKSIVVGAFLGETSKFIKSIKLGDTDLGYEKLNIPQKIQVIEKLPAALVQNILEKAVAWKNKLDEISKVKHQDFAKNIDVDSILFLTS